MIDLKIELPNNFLEEEERSGYLVTKKMKEIWAVELDLLAEFQRVCKKHNIQYFANAGTLLGAIRHQGIIPWDDDIDITILRSEYDRLCEVAPSEFQYPYFWQTEYTDKGSLRGHAQLRNSLTTGILNMEKGRGTFNQGIFIDIFPYDAVTDNEEEFKQQEKDALDLRYKFLRQAKWSDNFSPDQFPFPKNILYRPINFFLRKFNLINYDKTYREFEAVCQRYNGQETEFISCLSFDFNKVHFQPRKDYLESIEVPFEFLTIPVPKNYDVDLTMRFGNYMEFVRGGSYHGGVIFDTNTSYLEYINKYNYIKKK